MNMKRLYGLADLHALGIPGSNASIRRRERQGAFPERVDVGSKQPLWSASQIQAYLRMIGV
jgi:predicted DNA-binding transcriptional regulator AlpA